MKGRVIAGVALVVALAGCSAHNDARGRGDAPVGVFDDEPARVVNFPDQFHNIAFKCLGPNGIYAHTREAAPVVIPNDPNCEEGAAP